MKQTPLKAKTSLKAKTALSSGKTNRSVGDVRSAAKTKNLVSPIKSAKKRIPLHKKPARKLVEPADILFSRYVRLRDSVWDDEGNRVGECITCDRKLIVFTNEGKFIASSQNGHMIGRGCHLIRYDERNCNLQCAHCNAWLDKDEMISRYRRAVDMKYGDGTYKELKKLSRSEGAYKLLPKAQYLEIIKDSNEQIAFYLDNNNR